MIANTPWKSAVQFLNPYSLKQLLSRKSNQFSRLQYGRYSEQEPVLSPSYSQETRKLRQVTNEYGTRTRSVPYSIFMKNSSIFTRQTNSLFACSKKYGTIDYIQIIFPYSQKLFNIPVTFNEEQGSKTGIVLCYLFARNIISFARQTSSLFESNKEQEVSNG